MDIKVKFRFNKLTGEVEIFDIDNEGGITLNESEHNKEHDRIAYEIGSLMERNPLINELFPNTITDSDNPIINEEPEIENKKEGEKL